MSQLSVGDVDIAQDIVQEAMMKFFQAYNCSDQQAWRPLFFTVLANAINDFHRKHHRWTRLFRVLSLVPEPSVNLDEQLMHQQSFQRLSVCLQNMSPRQRQAFLLRCWEGCSTKETAEQMQCSEGSVKTHYARAFALIKNELEEYLP